MVNLYIDGSEGYETPLELGQHDDQSLGGVSKKPKTLWTERNN